MNRVFKHSDVVYHPQYGKGDVTSIDQSPRSQCPYHVVFKSVSMWCKDVMLSYEPWPPPVHVKPFQKGWYAYCNKLDGVYHIAHLSSRPEGKNRQLLHYFGTEMPTKEL